MKWSTFIQARNQDRVDALQAAQAALADDHGPASRMLASWKFSGDAALTTHVLRRLCADLPRPPDTHRSALLLDIASLPSPSSSSIAPWVCRRHLYESGLRGVSDNETHRLAWALAELRALGAEIMQRQRAPWRNNRYPDDAKRDGQTAAMWTDWFGGRYWSNRSAWEAMFLRDAVRAFASILRTRNFPDAQQRRILQELRDAFFFMLLGNGQDAPGWRELAVRVLETGPPSPIIALSHRLDARGWRAAALCAVSRGYGPRSAAPCFPDTPNPVHQARQIAERGVADAEYLDTVLDLHVAARLIVRWAAEPAATHPERSWQVVLQNRGRARARLRALLSTDARIPLLEPLLTLNGLYHRTRQAILGYCRDWAWLQLARHFPFHIHVLDPPCASHADEARPLNDDQRAAVQTWFLLVILKGRLGHLEQWIQTGGTGGDRDATWGRLLLQLPDELRTKDTRGYAARGQHHLRAELAALWPEALDAHKQRLRQIAALPDQDLRTRFNALLDQGWHGAIARPRVRFRGYRDNVIAALQMMEAR